MSYTSHENYHNTMASHGSFPSAYDIYSNAAGGLQHAGAFIAHMAWKAYNAAAMKIRERQNYHAACNLSDEILKDIGIQRSEIYYLSKRMAANPGVDFRELRG